MLYKQKVIINNDFKHNINEPSNDIKRQNEIIDTEQYKMELIKQIIALNDYTISFKASYDGFLYVTAKYANLYCDNKRAAEIIRHLEKYFIKEDTNISIKNINQLKSIRFVKWSNEEFIADINKGIFK